MKKHIKKNWLSTHKKTTALVVGVVLVLAAGFYFAAAKIDYINGAADQSSAASIRELILMASQDLKKDVPVEPKTGDLYFPESRLFLPNPKTTLKLTYAWAPPAEGVREELSVSFVQIPGASELYSARNVHELFETVPKLQSCTRGIKLVYDKFPADDLSNQLKHVVKLNNGKELYIYVEKDCPELNKAADLLTNIRAY
jgi:hypothetical protein